MTDDRPKHDPIPVLWFNCRGSGPDEFALQLNPLDKLMDGDRLVAPPTLGLMIRPGELVLLGREMINGGFQMDRAGVAKLHAQMGAWLAANPEDAR